MCNWRFECKILILICLSANLSVGLSVCRLSACLVVVCLFVCLPACQLIYLPSFCLPLSVCLSVCLFFVFARSACVSWDTQAGVAAAAVVT